MMPKQNDNKHDYLNISVLSPIKEGKENDIASLGTLTPDNYGYIVVKLMWRMIDVLHPDDRFTYSDKCLLEDVLRFGSLTRIAELRDVEVSQVSRQFKNAISHFTEAIEAHELAESERQRLVQTERRLAETEARLRELLDAEPLTPEQRRERQLLTPVTALPITKRMKCKLQSHGLDTVRDIVELPRSQFNAWFTPFARDTVRLTEYLKGVLFQSTNSNNTITI